MTPKFDRAPAPVQGKFSIHRQQTEEIGRRDYRSQTPIGPTGISTSGGTFLAAADGENFRIDALTVHSRAGTANDVDFHIFETGGTASGGNRVGRENIAANGTEKITFLTGLILEAGHDLYIIPGGQTHNVTAAVTRYERGE